MEHILLSKQYENRLGDADFFFLVNSSLAPSSLSFLSRSYNIIGIKISLVTFRPGVPWDRLSSYPPAQGLFLIISRLEKASAFRSLVDWRRVSPTPLRRAARRWFLLCCKIIGPCCTLSDGKRKHNGKIPPRLDLQSRNQL